ncbi:Guanylate cyclase soluble subunit beta-2 [Holothuria leucospilota]|uniref:guanylate cyclase n=1 Tax=Holothuria leucospilota TaxID=206669 RepID=A0A9Q1H6A2_HOLLE|nr:Guanylate cyclase soluble subunit beta-2 [Holothuria leucospilota]
MYGIINSHLKEAIIQMFGEEKWGQIWFDHYPNIFNPFENYDDEPTFQLIDTATNVLGLSRDDIWQLFGVHWVVWCMSAGYDTLFRTLGRTLEDFLGNLDYLHSAYMKTMYPEMVVPSFRVEKLTDGDVLLHYYSNRRGICGYVSGSVRGVARIIFNTEIEVSLLNTPVDKSTDYSTTKEHYVFLVHYVAYNLPPLGKMGFISEEEWMPIFEASKGAFRKCHENGFVNDFTEIQLKGVPRSNNLLKSSTPSPTPSCTGFQQPSPVEDMNVLLVDKTTFCESFPYHVVFDSRMVIRQGGNKLKAFCSDEHIENTSMSAIFDLVHPEIKLSCENIKKFQEVIFMLNLKPEKMKNTARGLSICLRGQMVWMRQQQLFMFLCSPHLTSLRDLTDRGMHFSDIAPHDITRDLILFNQQRIAEMELSRQLEEKKEELRLLMADLRLEKQKTDSLLYSMLPEEIANDLREGRTTEAGEFNEVTILFSDIVGFTDICSRCKPMKVVHMLNAIYSKFDELTNVHNVYKVETIGDAYMVVGGLPVPSESHAVRVAEFGLSQLRAIKTLKSPDTSEPLSIRVGIHTGPVVAGVVGSKMPRYCLFGDTVNTASRMESHGLPGKIHVSEEVLKHLKSMGFVCQYRGIIKVKGKGEMPTYFILEKRESVDELIIIKDEQTEEPKEKEFVFKESVVSRDYIIRHDRNPQVVVSGEKSPDRNDTFEPRHHTESDEEGTPSIQTTIHIKTPPTYTTKTSSVCIVL